MAGERDPNQQSFPEYAAETLGRLLDGLMTEREFATAIARAAAGEMPFTDAATDEYFAEDEPVSGVAS